MHGYVAIWKKQYANQQDLFEAILKLKDPVVTMDQASAKTTR